MVPHANLVAISYCIHDVYYVFDVQFDNTSADAHPDAHALRLKIFLLSAATGKSFSKDDIKVIRGEFQKYMSKAAHVSLECTVPANDLLQFNKKNGGFWNLGWIEEVIRYRLTFTGG